MFPIVFAPPLLPPTISPQSSINHHFQEERTMNAVEVNDLRKSFQLKKGNFFNRTTVEVPAVHGIDLSVKEGESVAFIGPNGAGKSTTIKILTGIMRPTSGSAQVLGLTPQPPRSQNRRGLRATISVVVSLATTRLVRTLGSHL